jgi:hypothetical protein
MLCVGYSNNTTRPVPRTRNHAQPPPGQVDCASSSGCESEILLAHERGRLFEIWNGKLRWLREQLPCPSNELACSHAAAPQGQLAVLKWLWKK